MSRQTRVLCYCLLLACLLVPLNSVAQQAATVSSPKPSVATSNIGVNAIEKLAPLLGIPYYPDGAQDTQGRYTTFANPEKILPKAGLNCSGFLLSAMRALTGQPITLEEAMRDRHNDSGAGAALGQDWDFGYDVLINLTQNRAYTDLTSLAQGLTSSAPQEALDAAGSSGLTKRGFLCSNSAAWERVFAAMPANSIALVSFSKDVNKAPYKVLHHHVGLLVRADATGPVWYYQSVKSPGVSRSDISLPKGLARLQKNYGKSHALVILLQ